MTANEFSTLSAQISFFARARHLYADLDFSERNRVLPHSVGNGVRFCLRFHGAWRIAHT
jgi:hypothetical protein